MNEDSKKFLEAVAKEEELENQSNDSTVDENGNTLGFYVLDKNGNEKYYSI